MQAGQMVLSNRLKSAFIMMRHSKDKTKFKLKILMIKILLHLPALHIISAKSLETMQPLFLIVLCLLYGR